MYAWEVKLTSIQEYVHHWDVYSYVKSTLSIEVMCHNYVAGAETKNWRIFVIAT
jgi:hypothetical protein